MFVSITRLHLNGKRKLPAFFWHTIKSIRQSKKAEGILYSSVDREGWLTYWTLTMWENKKHMENYRNQGNHLKAMKVSRKIASKIEYLNWNAKEKPSWDECKKLLNREFKKEKVKK